MLPNTYLCSSVKPAMVQNTVWTEKQYSIYKFSVKHNNVYYSI